MDKKQFIVNYIKTKLANIEELNKEYSEEKINTLAEKLISTGKTNEELTVLIDNKFSNQVRKINHNNHLSSLKTYYLSNIDKLKKGNNVYLLSYDKGIKILEQASITDLKQINPNLKQVLLNKNKKAYKKENSINNDYELIMSDIAYLLNIEYAKTYRVFDSNMNAEGILNESFEKENERFLNLEETLQFIQEESPKLLLSAELKEYHDRRKKYGIKEIVDATKYKENIEYVLKLFKALPDITEKNYELLKHDYLNMKIFELLTNSIKSELDNIGIIINKDKLKYTYRLSPSYNKYTINIKELAPNKVICNFYIVDKKELLHTIVNNYYKEIKELLSLIIDNKDTLASLIDQIIKEHLEYSEYNMYHKLITDNIKMIVEETSYKKMTTPDTSEDKKKYEKNNMEYLGRISPFIDNYIVEDVDASKGSVILTTVVATVLVVTAILILLAIYAVSKMDM